MTGRIDPRTPTCPADHHPLVTVKTRTMIVYRWEGMSDWLTDADARFIIDRDKRRERPIIAYVVRCRPRRRNLTPDWIPLDS